MKVLKVLILSFVILLLFSASGFSAKFILSSSPDGISPIKVNDDIKIQLTRKNQEIILVDDESQSPSEIPPVIFEAENGDVLEIEAMDTTEPADIEPSKLPKTKGYKELSPIYLVNMYTGRAICIFGGLSKRNSSWKGSDTFVKLSYTIGTPTKTYCLSSVPNGCKEIEVSDDLPLLKIASSVYSIEIHPDTDGKPRTKFSMNIVLPIVGDEKPTVEISLTNIYKDAYSTPIYLVPMDSIGSSIQLLGYPIFISGDCKSYTSCQEVTFYSFEGFIDLSGTYMEATDFVAEFSDFMDPRYYGFFADISLLKEPPVPMYVYFTNPDGKNVFLTDSGFSYIGMPIEVYGSIKGPVIFPVDESLEENILLAGNYLVNVADLRGKYIASYNFTIDTNERDIKSISEDFEYSYFSPESKGLIDTDEEFLMKNLATSTGVVEGYTFGFQEGNSTYACTLYPVKSSSIHNGFIYRPVSASDFKLFFILGLSCIGENSTEIDPSGVAKELQVEVDISKGDEKITLYSGNNTISMGNIIYIYAEYPLMDVREPAEIYYMMKAKLKSMPMPFIVGDFKAFVYPVEYEAFSSDEYVNGARLNINVSWGGRIYYTANFGIKIVNEETGLSPPKGYVRAYVNLDFNDDGVVDEKVLMTEISPGEFRAFVPLDSSQSKQISYFFEVTTSDRKPVTGVILQNVYSFSVMTQEYPVALKIGGDRHLILGEDVVYTFSVQTGYAQMEGGIADKGLDIYLGLYRKGRGTVWIVNKIPGAWVLSSSAKEQPIVENISFVDFFEEKQLSLHLKIPSSSTIEGALVVGEYAWILKAVLHDTGEEIAHVIFPFNIKPP